MHTFCKRSVYLNKEYSFYQRANTNLTGVKFNSRTIACKFEMQLTFVT